MQTVGQGLSVEKICKNLVADGCPRSRVIALMVDQKLLFCVTVLELHFDT